MLRRIALISFALAVAFVVACGHQVTPEPNLNNSNLAGKMVIKFRTNGQLNFNKYTYAIVIDTCGNGTPYPNVFGTTFFAYSYSFLLGGSYGYAAPTLVQYILRPNTTNSLNPQPVPLDPSLTNLTLPGGNQSNEFDLTFTRAQLNNPLGVAQPCPNLTPGPTTGPSPTASATATSSATPGASPSPSPTSSASSGPNSQATTSAQQYWYFNFFSIDSASNTILDSLGIGGPQDTTFNGVGVETGSSNQNAIFKQNGGPLPNDTSAQISGGEIDNYF